MLLFQDISKPIVPEVSILFDNPKKTASAGDGQPMSYKEWKEMQQNAGNKRKIVTFECSEQPVGNVRPLPAAQANPINANAYSSIGGMQHNIVQMGRTVSPTRITNSNPLNEREGRDLSQPRPQWPQEQSQQFTVDDMYKLLTLQQNMPVGTRKPAEVPAPAPVAQEPSDARQNVNVQDLFGLMLQMQQQTLQASKPKEDPSSPSLQPKQAETREVALRESETERREDEPTTKDLLQVILKQQEQLMNVQSQVHALVRAVSSSSSQNFANSQQAQKPMSVMTSLEINVQKIRNKKSPLDRRIIDTPAPALYEEEDESEDKENQSCRCNCKCASKKEGYPEAEVIRRSNLSSGSDTVTTTSPQSASGQPGWALYGNILSQVNDVLQNSPPADAPRAQSARSEQQFADKQPQPSDRNNYVASAQFKHLGIHFDDVNLAATSKR